MNKETIRLAKPEDVQDILVFCKLHAEYEGAEICAEESEYERRANSLDALVFGTAPAMRCLIGEIGGKPVGYATFMKQYSTWLAKPYLCLDCFFLLPETRGQGIGKLMMERVAAEAREAGCDHIEWQTPESIEGAVDFYRQMGATDRAKRRFVWDVADIKNQKTDDSSTVIDNPILDLNDDAYQRPYSPRRTRMRAVTECCGWQFKVYDITLDESSIPNDVVNSAMGFVAQHVAWPSTSSSKHGFVIINAGEQAIWVLVHLWMDDILRQFVFCAPLNQPTMFSVCPMDGFNACVWDLEVTKHERDAWVKHVLAQPLTPQFTDYLNDSLEIALQEI